MGTEITWAVLAGLKEGTGIGIELKDGRRYAGSLIKGARTSVRLHRVDDRGVAFVPKTKVARIVLLDWMCEQREFDPTS